jgi:hypothetical protein
MIWKVVDVSYAPSYANLQLEIAINPGNIFYALMSPVRRIMVFHPIYRPDGTQLT